MIISLDFDGLICENRYPDVGNILPNAKEVIGYLHSRGHEIVINTCRNGHYAENAKAYLTNQGIKFNHFNENSPKLIKRYNGDTRKISSDCYFDDRNISDLMYKKMLGVEGYNQEIWQQNLEQFEFLEKPVIICIIGESGSGKTLAAEYLDNIYDINLVQSYTDREKRHDNENGHTFLSKEEYNNLEGEVLASTTFGGNRYCCLESDLMHINCYVIDEIGLEMLKAKYDDIYDIYSIRLNRPEFDRREAVGDERVARDIGMFNMRAEEFDYIIFNDDTKKEDLHNKLEDFMSLFRLKERSKEYDIHIID